LKQYFDMGKKSATRRGSSSTGDNAVAEKSEVATSAQKIKEEGNKHFAKKEYQKALDAYDRALKACEGTSAEVPLLHSNKAACFMMQARFKEAVNECTSALALDASYAKALVRRSRAYESMQLYKQALSDIQKANKVDSANPDNQESEKRLKDCVAGKGGNPVVLANGTGKKAPSRNNTTQMLIFTVKCSLEGETRVMHILGQTSYAELLDQVQKKYPAAPPCVLKYTDKDGDQVTMTEKLDLHKALDDLKADAEKALESSHSGRSNLQQLLAPLRLTLCPVESREAVPQPPQEEQLQYEQMQQARKLLLLQQQAAAQSKQKLAEAEQQPQENFEIEQWLVDFANLFRDALGVEPDKHLDLTNFGWEKLQSALDSAVLSEEAPKLFDQAAERFQEVTAHGLLQWGNVHLCCAKRIIDKAAAEGKDITAPEVADAAEALFVKAEQKYEESLQTKPDFYDGCASTASLYFERGRLAAGFAVVPPKPDQPADKQVEVDTSSLVVKGDKTAKQAKEAEEAARQEASQAANQESLKAALGRLTAEGLGRGEPMFQKAWAKFQEAIDMLPEEEKNKPLKPPQEGKEAQAAPVEEDNNVWAHCQVMWGNLVYELSQMKAAVGEPWKPLLEEATGKFRMAGCPEADIRGALAGHTMKEEIDLGPEPEAGKDASSEAKKADVKTEDEEKVKGLPSLGPRPKKKAATEV